MGGLLSFNMEASYKKNQAFIDEMIKVNMERQIQAQNQVLSRQRALAIAGSRDTFHWYTAFYLTAATGLITGYRKTRKPVLMVPLVPLSFVTAYYWDLAYGNKINRIRMEAERVMTEQSDILSMPCGLPTPDSIELSRRDLKKD